MKWKLPTRKTDPYIQYDWYWFSRNQINTKRWTIIIFKKIPLMRRLFKNPNQTRLADFNSCSACKRLFFKSILSSKFPCTRLCEHVCVYLHRRTLAYVYLWPINRFAPSIQWILLTLPFELIESLSSFSCIQVDLFHGINCLDNNKIIAMLFFLSTALDIGNFLWTH